MLSRDLKDKIRECYTEKKYEAKKKIRKKLPRRVQQFLRRRFLKKHSFDFSYFSYVWDLDVPTGRNCIEENYSTTDCDLVAIRKFLYDILTYCHRDEIGTYLHKDYKWTCAEVAQDLRVYLKYLGRWDNTYKSRVWRAMAKIEDDWTLVQMSRDMMGYLWD